MEKIKIQAPRYKIYAAILGIVLFVVVGLLMLVAGESLFERLIGLITIVFFGGFAGRAMYRTLGKGKGYIVAAPTGLELNYPDCPPIPIRWEDIETFATSKVSGQHFTTVILKSYDQLVEDIPPKDAEIIVKNLHALQILGYATTVIGEFNAEDMSELSNVLPDTMELYNLATMLHYFKNKFGAEFHIAWNMRDRSAKDLADFLNHQRKAYTASI